MIPRPTRDRFGDLNVADITPAMIQDYADERIEEVKFATVQKELAILNKARREGNVSAEARCRFQPRVLTT